MSANVASRNPAPVARLAARLRVPLYRNGYALIASSALTSALGLVFWVVAARQYSPSALGVSAALIAAMTLLADWSHLNMKSALNRFLPVAGDGSARLTRRAYALALGVAGASSTVFILGLSLWSPRLGFLGDRLDLALWFVAGTMAWTIFVLQDSALAGIRRAGWVPLENLAFSVLKVALLPVLVVTSPMLGPFVAWSAAVLVVIVPVNVLLFRRLIPAHVEATAGRTEAIPLRRVARYVGADYAAYAIWSGTIGVLPIVVLHVAGAAASGYFFIAWSIAYALYLASSGMGMSLLAEASLEPERLREHARAAAVETARLVVPAVALVVAGAPLILSLMGDEYSGEAVTLLRLLALSAIPFVIVATAASALRVRQRMRAVIAMYAALCAIVLGLGLPLLSAVGIDGLGIAWLAAQSAVAVAIVAIDARGRLHVRTGAAVRAASAARRFVVTRWRRLALAGTLRPILKTLAAHFDGAEPWIVHRHVQGLNDVLITLVGPPGGRPAAVVKRSCTRAGKRSLAAQGHALLDLAGTQSVPAPRLLASGVVRGRPFVAESVVAGTPAGELLAAGLPRERFLAAVGAAVRPLHESDRHLALVDYGLLSTWVDTPLARLAPARGRSGIDDWDTALGAVRRELSGALVGRSVTIGRIHGDLCPDNVLMRGDGAAVAGIVDWEHAAGRGLPWVDLMHLLVTTRMEAEGRELGAVVAELLDGPFAAAPSRSDDPPDRAMLLLAWLGHVAANVDKSPRYARSRAWVRRNVDPVLTAVLEPGARPALAGAPAVSGVRRPGRARPRLRVARRTRSLAFAAPVVALGVALVLWALALGDIDPRAMTDFGLTSVLPPAFVAALVALTVSFTATACLRPDRGRLLGAHVVALIAVLHATPAIVYGTLRYSWAWKHVGIVDYIERHGAVAPDIDKLPVYHNWPGFFGLDALLGTGDHLALATWGPVIFNLLWFGALLFLFSGLTQDRRVVWLATWLFFVASWVGQDYFSPQAFAFFLYLVVAGVIVRWPGLRSGGAARWRPRTGALLVILLLVAVIAASHPLTGVMTALAVGALFASRATRLWILPLVAAALVAAWDLGFATGFVESNVESTLDSVSLPWTTTGSSLNETGQLSDAQALVALLGRGLAVTLGALALIGAARELRRRRLHRAAAALAIAPLALFGSGDYDGEILFRIYLFASPFLAFFAAHAFLTSRQGAAAARRSAVAYAAVGAVLAGLFLFAYYGNERQYYFTPEEVAAAEFLYTHAPAGSLFVEGTRNYPGQFKNYERFTYVPLSREPASEHARFVARPAQVFSEWMSDRRYPAAYFIITRSQKAEVEATGAMPPGSLDRIERSLSASIHFHAVYRNRDATIFALHGTSLGPGGPR